MIKSNLKYKKIWNIVDNKIISVLNSDVFVYIVLIINKFFLKNVICVGF